MHVHIQSQQKRVEFRVLTIFSSLYYKERILSYMSRDGPSLKYILYIFFSVDNFINFLTQNQLTQS